jgi:hypothetical protein
MLVWSRLLGISPPREDLDPLLTVGSWRFEREVPEWNGHTSSLATMLYSDLVAFDEPPLNVSNICLRQERSLRLRPARVDLKSLVSTKPFIYYDLFECLDWPSLCGPFAHISRLLPARAVQQYWRCAFLEP